MIETSDGGYAIAGGFDTPADFWLIKIDELGNVQWNMTYGGEEKDVAFSLVETSDGEYAIASDIFDWFIGDGLIWVIKTDDYGLIPYRNTIGYVLQKVHENGLLNGVNSYGLQPKTSRSVSMDSYPHWRYLPQISR